MSNTNCDLCGGNLFDCGIRLSFKDGDRYICRWCRDDQQAENEAFEHVEKMSK